MLARPLGRDLNIIGRLIASDGEAFHLPMIDIISIKVIFQLHQSQLLIIGTLAKKGFDIVVDVLYGLACHFWVRG